MFAGCSQSRQSPTRPHSGTQQLQVLAHPLQVHDVAQIHEQATGLAPPSRWDLVSDRQAMQEEQPLQVLQWAAVLLFD